MPALQVSGRGGQIARATKDYNSVTMGMIMGLRLMVL